VRREYKEENIQDHGENSITKISGFLKGSAHRK
jgi:hypothetical protein